nr:uncharacterized protein LOC113392725 [Vanessa tameamea]
MKTIPKALETAVKSTLDPLRTSAEASATTFKSGFKGFLAKWQEITGVVCDRRICRPSLRDTYSRVSSKSDLLYRGEFWPVLSRHNQDFHVTEMKMLRWICGVTRAHPIRYSCIQGSLGVRDLSAKHPVRRLRRYGPVARRLKDYIGRKCLDMFVPGTRPSGCTGKLCLDVLKHMSI